MSSNPVPMTISSPVGGDRDRAVERVGAEEREHERRAVLRAADDALPGRDAGPRAGAASPAPRRRGSPSRGRPVGRSRCSTVLRVAAVELRAVSSGMTSTARERRPRRARAAEHAAPCAAARARAGAAAATRTTPGTAAERRQPHLVVVPVAGDERGPRRRSTRRPGRRARRRRPTSRRTGRAARARSTIQRDAEGDEHERAPTAPARSGAGRRRPRRAPSRRRPGPSTRRTGSRPARLDTDGAATSAAAHDDDDDRQVPRDGPPGHVVAAGPARSAGRDEPDEGEERRARRARWAG